MKELSTIKQVILRKLAYHQETYGDDNYNVYYFEEHKSLIYLVYSIVILMNANFIYRILSEDGFKQISLIPIALNLILIIITIVQVSVSSKHCIRLSCLINILFAIQLYFYIMRYQEQINEFGQHLNLGILIIFGQHANLLLSNSIICDFVAFAFNLIFYSYSLSQVNQIQETFLLACTMICSFYFKYIHLISTHKLYLNMEQQQQWIDVIDNVIPSAIISLKRVNMHPRPVISSSQSMPSQKLVNLPDSSQQNKGAVILTPSCNPPPNLVRLQGQDSSFQIAGSENNTQPPNYSLCQDWSLGFMNKQSEDVYNIKNMESLISFTESVFVDIHETLSNVSSGLTASPNLKEPSQGVDEKQLLTLNQNNKSRFDLPIIYSQTLPMNNIVDKQTTMAAGMIPMQKAPPQNSKGNHKQGEEQQRKIRMKKSLSADNRVLQHLPSYGQFSRFSFQAEGDGQFTTLFQKLKTLLEEFEGRRNNKLNKEKFSIWKLNGKYLKSPVSQQNITKETILQDGVSISITVCMFHGNYTRFVFCVDDISISDKIQLYQSRDKYKDLVLANAAHDLRQPLNTLSYTISEAKRILNHFDELNLHEFILKYDPSLLQHTGVEKSLKSSQNLGKNCTEIQMISELLEMADISNSSLKYLINDILDHAMLREGKLQANFKECSLNEIICFTRKMFGYSFKDRGLKYHVINEAQLGTDRIFTDQQRLQQVLVNLISNAIKFTPANKYIILHVVRVFKNVNNRSVSLLKISLLDQGCGMSKEQLQQIFKPYATFNNNNLNGQGIGLGLHICKSIISLLGPYPKLFVRSKLNEGTRFFFYIYHQQRKGVSIQRLQSDKSLKEATSSKKEEVVGTNPLEDQIENKPDQVVKKTSDDEVDIFGLKKECSIMDDLFQSKNKQPNESKCQEETNRESSSPFVNKKYTTTTTTTTTTMLEEDKKKKVTIQLADNEKDSNPQNLTPIEEYPHDLKNSDDEKENCNSELDMSSILMRLIDVEENEIKEDVLTPVTQSRTLAHRYSQIGQGNHTILALNTCQSKIIYSPKNSLSDENKLNCDNISANFDGIHIQDSDQHSQTNFITKHLTSGSDQRGELLMEGSSPILLSNHNIHLNESPLSNKTDNSLHQQQKSKNYSKVTNPKFRLFSFGQAPDQVEDLLVESKAKFKTSVRSYSSLDNQTRTSLLREMYTIPSEPQNKLLIQSGFGHSLYNTSNLMESSPSINKKSTFVASSKSPEQVKGLKRQIPDILKQFQKKFPNALSNLGESDGNNRHRHQKQELQVLITDDDTFSLSILKLMLKKSSLFTFEIKETHNGFECLQEFKKRNYPSSLKPFALVIIDFNMPIMDGITSTREMRKIIKEQNFHSAIFVGVSGLGDYLQTDSKFTGEPEIFDAILSKPIQEQAIINVINQNFLDFY